MNTDKPRFRLIKQWSVIDIADDATSTPLQNNFLRTQHLTHKRYKDLCFKHDTVACVTQF